jgi:hypothetical protein
MSQEQKQIKRLVEELLLKDEYAKTFKQDKDE